MSATSILLLGFAIGIAFGAIITERGSAPWAPSPTLSA